MMSFVCFAAEEASLVSVQMYCFTKILYHELTLKSLSLFLLWTCK